MKQHIEKVTTSYLSLTIAILVIGLAFQGYFIYNAHITLNALSDDISLAKNTINDYQSETASTTREISQKLVLVSDMLYEEQKISEDLQDSIKRYDRQVDKLSDSVDTLEKISTTDPELLQKYSKVYFLNEHYMPADLTIIDEKYDYENGKEVSIHSDVWPFLEELLEEADDDNVDLMVLSGYRSFEEQATLKGTYTVTYGTGANTFSADQGYSEHQLGTTVDFTTPYLGSDLSRFVGTDEHAWLVKNAYKYGFTMSYPPNNDYYEYEPWHWRFVGEDLARDLKRKNKFFYDLEQREIDTYIAELFD